ncbi:HAD family hydrolase [Clostridium sp. LBM24168]
MKYKYVLFDLDGTLTDSKEGITKSVQYALKKFGITVENLDFLEKFIGPPLKESFMIYYNFSEACALKAIEYYREYFRNKGIFQNKVYEDVYEMLGILKDKGIQIILATSKPTIFAKMILEYFNLNKYFQDVIGSNLDGTRSKKAEVITYIIDKCNINDLEKAIMVGDREHDIIGARENTIDCIAVSYGYGTLREIKNAKPTYIADNVMDIPDKII